MGVSSPFKFSCVRHGNCLGSVVAMPGPYLETKSEPELQKLPKLIGLFIFVLRYEELCAEQTMVLPPLARDQSSLDIGRAGQPGRPALEGRTFLLPDPYASRLHARITRRGMTDFIEDLGSKQGTYVNAERITQSTALLDGDCIEIGHSLFVYRRTDPLWAARLASTDPVTVHGPTATVCPEMVQVSQDLERIAKSVQPVLILAETGAGKEIAANFVHQKSARTGPFVAIDCGAIAPHLVEAELFGHKRGAFSGAHEERLGRIRSAEAGTVFLDEIGNMPLQAQASLLRVVQEREVIPVGADKGKSVNVRWVAATNADLFSENSGFRSDLRARLSGYVAQLPPLRKRREDLGYLCAFLLRKVGFSTASITRQAARVLFLSDLSGNVRELERALASAVVLKGDGPIDVHHLSVLAAKTSSEHKTAPDTSATNIVVPAPGAKAEVPERERPYTRRPSKTEIEEALVKAKRIQSEAARILGVHERQLARWMDSYGIERAKRGLLK